MDKSRIGILLALFSLPALAVPGCGGKVLPGWMSFNEEDEVIQSTESREISPLPVEHREPAVYKASDKEKKTKLLSLQDLVEADSPDSGGSTPGEKPADNTKDNWDDNLQLPPLKGDKGKAESKFTVVATEEKIHDTREEKVSTPETDGEKMEIASASRMETDGPSAEFLRMRDELQNAISRASGSGSSVPYEVIQDQIMNLKKEETAKTDKTPPPEKSDDQAVTEGKGEKSDEVEESSASIVPENDSENIVPIQVPERVFEPRRLAIGEEIVVSPGAVQVNERFLTADELLDGMHEEFLKVSRDLSKDEFKNQAADIIAREIHYQVQQALVLDEARSRLKEHVIEYINADIEKEIRRMIAEAGGSREALDQRCLREGITLAAMERILKRDYLITTYLQQKFYPRIVVNRRTLWDYYRKHMDEFTTGKKVRMQLIAALFDKFEPLKSFKGPGEPGELEQETAEKAAKKQIEKALKELEKGTDFAEAAKKYSNGPMSSKGGIWELMERGNKLEEKVEKKAFELGEGERSGIIREPNGYFIVRAYKVVEGKSTGFVKAQEEIAKKLRKQEYAILRDQYFREVYENTTIEIDSNFVQKVVDRAVERYWSIR